MLSTLLAIVLLFSSNDRSQNAAAQTPIALGGLIWNDSDLDGVRGPDEKPAAFTQVTLPPSGDRFQTGADGRYAFTVLPIEGVVQYEIQVFAIASTFPVRVPEGRISRFVQATQTQTDLDFGIVGPQAFMQVRGNAWVDAAPARVTGANGVEIRAFIGPVDCTLQQYMVVIPPDTGPGPYGLHVAPDGLVPGCGKPGALVRFILDGREMNETFEWQADSQFGRRLTAGPAFAIYSGNIWEEVVEDSQDPSSAGLTLEGFIDGRPCSQLYYTFGGFLLVVLPESLKPRCGSEGSQIVLQINGRNAPAFDLRWTAGSHDLDLRTVLAVEKPRIAPTPETPATPVRPPVVPTPRLPAIRPPDTGDGGLLTAR